MRDGQVVAIRQESMARGQDARLVPLVQDLMAEVAVDYTALDRIAVTTGPGSFTGIRIGLAAARGFGLAATKPVIGVDRFALYRELNPNQECIIVLESKRAELYVQYCPANGTPYAAQMLTRAEITRLQQDYPAALMVGDVPEFSQSGGDAEILTLARMAAKVDARDVNYLPRPYYLRDPDVTFSRKSFHHAGDRPL